MEVLEMFDVREAADDVDEVEDLGPPRESEASLKA